MITLQQLIDIVIGYAIGTMIVVCFHLIFSLFEMWKREQNKRIEWEEEIEEVKEKQKPIEPLSRDYMNGNEIMPYTVAEAARKVRYLRRTLRQVSHPHQDLLDIALDKYKRLDDPNTVFSEEEIQFLDREVRRRTALERLLEVDTPKRKNDEQIIMEFNDANENDYEEVDPNWQEWEGEEKNDTL